MFPTSSHTTDPVRAVRFDYVKSIIPKPFAEGWPQLWSRLCVRKETKRKDQRGLWSPVIYAPGSTRSNYNVEAVTCLVVDMDGESFDYAKLDGLEWFAYTTWSHRPDDEHWHLVLPLKEPVPAHRWGGPRRGRGIPGANGPRRRRGPHHLDDADVDRRAGGLHDPRRHHGVDLRQTAGRGGRGGCCGDAGGHAGSAGIRPGAGWSASGRRRASCSEAGL